MQKINVFSVTITAVVEAASDLHPQGIVGRVRILHKFLVETCEQTQGPQMRKPPLYLLNSLADFLNKQVLPPQSDRWAVWA